MTGVLTREFISLWHHPLYLLADLADGLRTATAQ
jgi:hypothetical protein